MSRTRRVYVDTAQPLIPITIYTPSLILSTILAPAIALFVSLFILIHGGEYLNRIAPWNLVCATAFAVLIVSIFSVSRGVKSDGIKIKSAEEKIAVNLKKDYGISINNPDQLIVLTEGNQSVLNPHAMAARDSKGNDVFVKVELSADETEIFPFIMDKVRHL